MCVRLRIHVLMTRNVQVGRNAVKTFVQNAVSHLLLQSTLSRTSNFVSAKFCSKMLM